MISAIWFLFVKKSILLVEICYKKLKTSIFGYLGQKFSVSGKKNCQNLSKFWFTRSKCWFFGYSVRNFQFMVTKNCQKFGFKVKFLVYKVKMLILVIQLAIFQFLVTKNCQKFGFKVKI